MNFVTSRYLAFSDTFEENEIYKRIIYSTRTSITALIEENIFQELLKNNYSNIENELLDLLFSMEIIIPENEKFLDETLKDKSSFSLFIQPPTVS